MLPSQVPTAIRKSDCKPAQLRGFTPDDDDDEYDAEQEDLFVWDVSNPFATPDPAEERLRNLIQAEITHMRRYESVGPLQSLPRVHCDDDDDEEDYSDETDDDDEEDYSDETDADADDEDEGEDDKPTPIVLPRLLHTRPLCYLTSPPSSTPSSPDDEDPSAPWEVDLADAEDQERARKAKRDAHRSRLKAIAILGPEASSAI